MRFLAKALILFLLFVLSIGQAQETIMTSAEAKVKAIDAQLRYHRPPRFLQKIGLWNLVNNFTQFSYRNRYQAGEPILMNSLHPDDVFFENNTVKDMCKQSGYYVKIYEGKNYDDFYITTREGKIYSGLDGLIESGVDECLRDFKATDEYYVPIYNSEGKYLNTISLDVDGSGAGGSKLITTDEARQLANSDTQPQLYSFNIPTDFEPYEDDWIEGYQLLWLVDELAIDARSGEVFQVSNFEGIPVDVRSEQLEPYIELRNFGYIHGPTVRPKLLYPVRLEPVNKIFDE